MSLKPSMESALFDLFATCPKGLEALLVDELKALGAQDLKATVAGVAFTGDEKIAYKICLWSRLANRILMPLKTIDADSADDLYSNSLNIAWEEHLNPDGKIWIDFTGQNRAIRNTQFGAQKIKDAIVDRMRRKFNQRPDVTRELPDLTINVRLHRDKATISIDLSGESLHKRGYRAHQMAAPLKENLAAALLIRAGWQQHWREWDALLDPMCGSGTLLIEAALMACDIAPGLLRYRFGFEKWLKFNAELWQSIRSEAEERREKGLQQSLPEIRGYDESIGAIRSAEQNIEDAELQNIVRVILKPLDQFKKPTHTVLNAGLIITNPPYGERLGEEEDLIPLYQQLGRTLKENFQGWRAAVFTSNQILARSIGLRSYKQFKLFNGTIASELLLIDISEDNHFVEKTADELLSNKNKKGDISHSESNGENGSDLSEGATMVANRLKKNLKALAAWKKKSNIACYRLYDADLPEYSAAIDIYQTPDDEVYANIQEYAPPKTVDDRKAQQRLSDIIVAVKQVLRLEDDHISLKQRRRNKGKQQYEALSAKDQYQGKHHSGDKHRSGHKQLYGKSNESNVRHDPYQKNNLQPARFQVEEGQATYWVDLWSYLDTGLFLDHRLVREKLKQISLNKKVLNLFCYTATATVQAAIGGAKSSFSVDMSKTYLDWASDNFALNRLSDRHQLVQADCLEWLNQCRESFDVIFLDPPSFSNSKRMEGTLDIQRDHVKLISRCMDLLNPGGTLLFSNNLRSFKLDRASLSRFTIDDISADTIDKDFQRNQRIHQCFLITAK